MQNKAKFIEIAHSKDGHEARKLSNAIVGLDVEKWNAISSSIMRNAIYFKFRKNQDIIDELLATERKCLVEARDDKVWGTGMKGHKKALTTAISQWPENNKLSKALIQTRNFFKDLVTKASGILGKAFVYIHL